LAPPLGTGILIEDAMPRAFLHFENVHKEADSLDGPACDLIVNEPGRLDRFEYWYVDENYALIDDEGNRYALRWDSSEGMTAEIVETSTALRSLFYKWLEVWIAGLPSHVRKALNIADTDRSETYLSILLDDAELLQRLSARK
jgi:hypothetical protein